MKKILFIAVIFLISCSKEETPQPSVQKQIQPTNNTIVGTNINGTWYDYTHISGNNSLVPVMFTFDNDYYTYSEYNATHGWDLIVGITPYVNNNDELTFAANQTNYRFFGTVLTDSTIQITQYSGVDTLPSYTINKEQ